jgi:hypothetical protein
LKILNPVQLEITPINQARQNKMKLKSSMKTTLTLLLALFASFTTNSQAATTTITALPFNISAPGTYVLATDLTVPSLSSGAVAITIYQSNFTPTGTIILDLGGHTIHGGAFTGMRVSSTNYITIMNGTLDGFSDGIDVVMGGGTFAHLLIDNITFKSTKNNTSGITMSKTNGAVVSRCNFIGPMYCGVSDHYSTVGSTFINLNFDGNQTTNIQEGGNDGLPYPQTVNFNTTLPQPK